MLIPKASTIFKKFNMELDTRCANISIKRKVSAECNHFAALSIGMVVISVTVHIITWLPVSGDESTYVYSQLIVEEYGGRFRKQWTAAELIAVLIMGVGLPYSILCGLYLILLGKLQIYLIMDKVLEVSKGFSYLKEDDLMDDDDYQNTVYMRLRTCIEAHVKFIKFKAAATKSMRIVITSAPILSVIPIAAAYFIINDISPRNSYRMVFAISLFCYVVLVICKIGQDFDDVMDSLYRTIAETPWVSWNKKNRQALLIMLMNAKPVQLSAYNFVTVNNRLLLTIYKFVYPLATALF